MTFLRVYGAVLIAVFRGPDGHFHDLDALIEAELISMTFFASSFSRFSVFWVLHMAETSFLTDR